MKDKIMNVVFIGMMGMGAVGLIVMLMGIFEFITQDFNSDAQKEYKYTVNSYGKAYKVDKCVIVNGVLQYERGGSRFQLIDTPLECVRSEKK